MTSWPKFEALCSAICRESYCKNQFSLQKELGNKKAERFTISDKTFGNVPKAGAFSNQFIEGMKKLYELQSFLDVRLLRPGEDSAKVREELLVLTGT